MIHFLEKLMKGNGAVKQLDADTFLITDINLWNSNIQNKIMYYYPRSRIHIQMDKDSVSGFSVRVVHAQNMSRYLVSWGIFMGAVVAVGYIFFSGINQIKH